MKSSKPMEYFMSQTFTQNLADPDSIASEIVDINNGYSYGTKEKYKNPFKGDYSDAVIYEMHIRDWSKAFVAIQQENFKI